MALPQKMIKRGYKFFNSSLCHISLTFISMIYLAYISPIAYGYNFELMNFFMLVLLFLFARYHFITVIIMFVYSIIAAIYLPFGITYGQLNGGLLYALRETNLTEAFDNILIYPGYYYLLSLLVILSSSYYVYSYWKYGKKSKHILKQLIFLILFPFIFILLPSGDHVTDAVKQSIYFFENIEKFEQSFNSQPTWDIISVDKKNNNIVVVIGESVNREYLSLYGYHHQTTPFLNKANGIFIDGYIATAPFTTYSLSRTLAQTLDKEEINFANNIVTLAKQAGYKTYWISNQGVIGIHDSLISQIAMYADNIKFLNEKTSINRYRDDFDLLDELDKILVKDPSPKIIFVHMYGSHNNPCKRLFNYPNSYNLQYGIKFNCYLATLNKLDAFIENINNQLIQANKDYSLIYFSDHGQKMSFDENNQVMIQHSGKYKQGYKVPLFIIKSNIKDHIYTKKNLSAFHFLDLFANEIGVKSDQLSTEFKFEAFPLESNIMVKTYDELAYYDELLDDKIIDQ